MRQMRNIPDSQDVTGGLNQPKIIGGAGVGFHRQEENEGIPAGQQQLAKPLPSSVSDMLRKRQESRQ